MVRCLMEKTKPAQDSHSFKDTLNLPKTDFSIRAHAAENDPKTLVRWEEEDLYSKSMECHAGSKQFILHDGPPYANGNIHLGHAYNKILKDIVAKSHRMIGFHAPVIPGWDCHGLPIEQKVSQENPGLTGAELKKACRTYAQKWVDTQKEEFKKLGILMKWDKPYVTMDTEYEANTVRALADFVRKGFVERKNKTIPWCPSCATALASAEIEYQDRKDPSIYVLFPMDGSHQSRLFPDIVEPVNFLIWTTTPWTIPLNRAVMLKPNAEYQLLKINGVYVLVGATLSEKIGDLVEGEKELVASINSDKLQGSLAQHPMVEDLRVPILYDASVGLDEGTACVHSAPGCGPIDYEIGVKHGLEIYSPITADGKYSDAIKPVELEGISVADGQIWVIKRLAADGKLFAKKNIRHSYPHCWRCRGGLIFRATPQWFCNLEHKGVKAKAIAAVVNMKFYPDQGRNFLRATIENRWEWCLSRQRAWGVPIPALLSLDSKDVYMDATFMDKVAERVAKEGIEYWDNTSLQEMKQEGMLPIDFQVEKYRKETDILDVWFDSGISNYAVLKQRPDAFFPASLYLEGIDQHRGWFQSSLLSSIILHGEPQTQAIMTHGFTVDKHGHKMSKSRGNVVSPQEIIKQLGTDGLRLWVSSLGNEGDAIVSDALLKNIAQVYRKIRNTTRFLLQNLYDYDHAKDSVPLDELSPVDAYALFRLAEVNEQVITYYKQMNLTGIYHLLTDYCTTDLSSFYADIVKDRLYCEEPDGYKRRSTQTVLWYILDTLTRLIAPILSFTAESIADHYQVAGHPSVHLQKFVDHASWQSALGVNDVTAYKAQWKRLREIRSAVLKAIEKKREEGIVKHSLEAAVKLRADELDMSLLGDNPEEFLKEFFIVSRVELVKNGQSLELVGDSSDAVVPVVAQKAAGTKCPRCWHWDVVDHQAGLCCRCQGIVK